MNSQAQSLQQLVSVLDPQQPQASVRWLVHSAMPGTGVSTIRRAISSALNSMGWVVNRIPGPGEGALAQLSSTQGQQIQWERMKRSALIIFVMDANPVTLVNTYSQIKQLAVRRSDIRHSLAVVVNHTCPLADPQTASTPLSDGPIPMGLSKNWHDVHSPCPGRKLLGNCRKFLGFQPTYLGAVSYCGELSQDGTSSDETSVEELPTLWREEFRPIVRRALVANHQMNESTQGPDKLSQYSLL